MKNIALCSIMILVLLLVGVSIWFLYQNRSYDKVLELSFKSLLVPVVVAFGLLVIEVIKPITPYKKEFIIASSENPFEIENLILSSGASASTTTMAYSELKRFKGLQKNLPDINYDNSHELLEIFVYRLLHERYGVHWKASYERSLPFFGVTSSMSGVDAEVKKEIATDMVTLQFLQEQTDTSQLLNKLQGELSFGVPPSTSKNYTTSKIGSSLQLSNEYFEFQLNVTQKGAGNLPHSGGREAELIMKKLGLARNESWRLDIYGSILSIEAKPKRLYRWHPSTQEYLKWAEQLSNYLQDSFSWSVVMDQIEAGIDLQEKTAPN